MTQTTPASDRASGNAPMIRMTDVQKYFDDFQALKDINLEVPKGQVVVVLGPSGSGKSTLCRTINRLETIESGTIEIDGVLLPEEGRDLARLRADVGMVFQSFNLFPHLTIKDNVTLGPVKVRKMKKADAEKRAMALLERVGIANQASKYPAQLSGGQQQRVALARVVIRRPRLLLLDEPLSSLDGPTRSEVRRELRQVLRAIGVPTVLVTHDRIEAITLADHVVVLSEGSVRQSGSVEDVFSRPEDLSVARIVGIETVVHGTVTGVDNGLTTVSVGETLVVVLGAGLIGDRVSLCIRGEDVILQEASKRTSGIRNQFPGQVLDVVHEGTMMRVGVDCGFRLTAVITKQTREELQLQEGSPVTALVKAAAIHVIPRD